MHTCRSRKKGFEIKKQTYGPPLYDILEDALSVFNISYDEIIGSGKRDKYVSYRQVYIFSATQLTDAKLANVGAVINKDYTNVLYHKKLCKSFIENSDVKFGWVWNKYIRESKIWGKYYEIK